MNYNYEQYRDRNRFAQNLFRATREPIGLAQRGHKGDGEGRCLKLLNRIAFNNASLVVSAKQIGVPTGQ
jgi:hypothetical protein